MDWNAIWQSVKDFFTNNFWNVIGWIATLFIGIIVVKILLNITRSVMNKSKMEKVTQGFIYNIIKLILYLVLILILLSMLGVAVSGIITALSALVLAIGMALQSIIANVANGIILVSSHIVKKGDFISVSGVDGSVDNINFLFTTILTTDNKRITIPNSTLVNNAVTNYGANKLRRVDFTFGVAYESDVETVKNIIIDVMKSNGKVRTDIGKDPFCRLKVLNSSSIDFFANCWVDAEDYWDVYYYVIENVFNEFKRNNISIPYNQIEIRERKDNVVMPVANKKLERVEKVRIEKKKSIDLEKDNLLAIFKKKDKKSKVKKEEKDNK